MFKSCGRMYALFNKFVICNFFLPAKQANTAYFIFFLL